MVNITACLLAATTLLGGAATRPTIAIVPPVAPQGERPWIGTALADDLNTRLLIHSRVDPKTMQRFYPLSVFSWRQSVAAARGDGIDINAPLLRKHALRLAEQLGADYVFTGTYRVQADTIDLSWGLVGASGDAKPQRKAVKLSHLASLTETIFNEVLRVAGGSPKKARGHAVKGYATAAMEKYGEALLITRKQSLDPRAGLILTADELARARALLTEATQVAPEFARAWVERGVVSAMLNDFPQAEENLVQAMAQDGEFSPTTALGLYYLYDRQHKHDEAIKVLKDSTDTHLGFLHGLGYLGLAYLRANHSHEALTVFTTYQSRAPRNPWVQAMRTETLTRIGKHDLAIKEAQALQERLPKSIMVQANLASRLIDATRYAEARVAIAKALETKPDHPLMLTRLSYVELLDGKAETALGLAKRAVAQLGRGRGETLAGYAHVNLAHALALLGKRDEAFAALEDALKLGLSTDDRLALLKDPRLKDFLNDARCPIRPGTAHEHGRGHGHGH